MNLIIVYSGDIYYSVGVKTYGVIINKEVFNITTVHNKGKVDLHFIVTFIEIKQVVSSEVVVVNESEDD